MNPVLTIVVPVFNIKEDYLDRCIDSVLETDCNEIKLLLIDDGSTDKSGEICDRYAQKFSCIDVVHKKNQGVSSARNDGLKLTSSKWIMFVDGDDWVESKSLSRVIEYLKNEFFDADIAFCNYFDEYFNKSKVQRMNNNNGFLDSEIIHSCRIAPFYKFVQNGVENSYSIAVVWNKIFRTEFLKSNCIEFNTNLRLGEDRVFNSEALFKTDKIYYFDEIIYHYRWLNGSTTNHFNLKIKEDCLNELNSLKQVLIINNKYSEIENYFISRVCTRLYSCMRLYFFNKENKQSFNNKKNELKEFISNDIFQYALKNVKMNLFSFQERIFVFCIKYKLFFISYVLMSLKNYITNKKLD